MERRTSQKAEILRDIITADRAFTMMIAGQPNDFTIRVGIEKWVQNMAVAAARGVAPLSVISCRSSAVNAVSAKYSLHLNIYDFIIYLQIKLDHSISSD